MCDAGPIAEAYNDIRSDATPTSWGIFGYEDDRKTLKVLGTGEGDFAEMKESGLWPEDELAYGFLRVTSGDEESKRAKFMFMSWCGEKAKPLRRAKMSVHKADVKKVIQSFGVEGHYENLGEMDVDEVVGKIKKASGADYSGNPGAA